MAKSKPKSKQTVTEPAWCRLHQSLCVIVTSCQRPRRPLRAPFPYYLLFQGTILLPLPPRSSARVTNTSDPTAATALSDMLMQLISHCPQGAERLVDALERLLTVLKVQQYAAQAGSPAGSPMMHAYTAAAAAAKSAVQAWTFVLQWVLQVMTGRICGMHWLLPPHSMGSLLD